jgi:hypothetical protein
MEENRHGVVFGILLILLGGFFLAVKLYPQIFGFVFWPFIVIGIGGVFLISALLTRTGGLAIPGCILAGIGGILYYQAVTGDWASWAYIWTLIPGFVGLGVIIAGLLSRGNPHFDSGGLVLMAISAMGFLIFTSVFGNIFGFDMPISTLWPLFLIGIGLITLFSAIFRKR